MVDFAASYPDPDGAGPLPDGLRVPDGAGATPIHIDLAECESVDSTILGLFHQYAEAVILHRPVEKVRSQFAGLGLQERFTVDDEPPPEGDALQDEAVEPGEGDPSDLILAAHESLMDSSDDNRQRFRAVVDLIRKRQTPSETE